MWFTELGQVTHEAAHLGDARHLDAAGAALLSGDPVRLIEAFPGGVRIDDPRAGRVEGEAALHEFCRSSGAWMGERNARPRQIGVTIGRDRVVGEFEVTLTQDGTTFVLPIGVVVEPVPAAQSVWIRTYHSQWPLLGHHVVRPPLLPRNPNAHESDVVGEYQAASVSPQARSSAAAAPLTSIRSSRSSSARAAGSSSSTAR